MKYLVFLSFLLFWSCTGQQMQSNSNVQAFDTAGFSVESVAGSNLKYVCKTNDKHEIEQEGYLKNGVQHGTWVTFNKDGWMEYVNQYEHGVLNGPQLTFNKRGQILERKTFWNGELSGLFVQFRNGRPLKEIMYRNGKVNGAIKEFTRDGKLIKLAEYKDNELHGKVETFNEEGKLVLKYLYENGKKLSGGIVE